MMGLLKQAAVGPGVLENNLAIAAAFSGLCDEDDGGSGASSLHYGISL